MANKMSSRKVVYSVQIFFLHAGTILVISPDVPVPFRIHVMRPSLMEGLHKQDREGLARNPSELEELHRHSSPANEERPQDYDLDARLNIPDR